MSFKFARIDSLNSSAGRQENQYLNYNAGQYCVVNLGTREDPEGPVRSFTTASSPTEEDFILITTRIRDTPFKKKKLRFDPLSRQGAGLFLSFRVASDYGVQ